MKYFRLWNNKEKTFLNSVNYVNIDQANEDKESFLDAGNYPDEPHNVIQIHEYEDGKFIENHTLTGNW